MKICLLSSDYPSDSDWGGIGKYTFNLAHGLEKIGQDVSVITTSKKRSDHYLDGSINVYRIKTSKSILYSPQIFPFKAYREIIRLIKKNNLDVVEAPLTFGDGLVFSLIKLRPFVVSLHTPSFIMSKIYNISGLSYSRWQMLEKTLLENADRILCNTSINANLIANRYKVDYSKMRIVPHGISIEKYHFSNHGLKGKKGLSGKKIVLFVGRLEKRKGVDLLLKAIPDVVRQIPNVVFVFIGADTKTSPAGGSYRQYILEQSKVNCFQSHICLIGWVSEEELIEFYFSCDVFVAPSIYESFGLVYLEAMACGKPVIGTDIGGIPEVVNKNKTGLLIPLGNKQALIDSLVDLLIDEKKRELIGKTARQEVEENFTDTVMAKKTLKVFEELI